MNKQDLIATQSALISSWQIVPQDENSVEINRSAMLESLAQRVRHYLDNDYSRLVNALYRLDIPEEKTNEAMSLAGQDERALALAEMILQREYQKAIMRREYEDVKDIRQINAG